MAFLMKLLGTPRRVVQAIPLELRVTCEECEQEYCRPPWDTQGKHVDCPARSPDEEEAAHATG